MTETKRAAIFGVGGVSGIALGNELKENGYEVIGLDIKEKEDNFAFDAYYKCDITDFRSVKSVIDEINPTVIFNLTDVGGIGQAWKNPQRMMEVNMNGTINILETCKDYLMKPKILLVGSGDQYAPSDYPLSEESELRPASPYAVTKIAQEKIAEIYRTRYGLSIYCVRPFNHTGVGQNENFAVPMWCKQAAELKSKNQPGTIYVGNLDVSRDFLDVKDLVNAYRLVVEKGSPEKVYNVGYGVSYLLRKFVDYIISLTGLDIKVQVDGNYLRPTDVKYSCCDHSRITKELGWEPKYNIYNTIKEVYDSYLNKYTKEQ